MQWNDNAIVLSVRKFSEHGAVVTLLSRKHGLYTGVCKSALGKRKRGIYQPGNWVNATWKARLEEHMGTLDCELEKPVAALVMQDRKALAGLNAICAMIPLAMHERDPHPNIYDAAQRVMEKLVSAEGWAVEYIAFELTLLRDAGYGLDLGRCAATGKTDDLLYVSPKSGCAVSAQAGEPYKDKLLPLPAFFNVQAAELAEELRKGFELTSYFLNHWLLQPHGGRLPAARTRLVELVS